MATKKKEVPAEGEVKLSPLDKALSDLGKKYSIAGAGAEPLDVVDTGSIMLNAALECGGWPVGKLIELQGPESSGKTTLILHAIANFQAKFPDRKALLVDYEHGFSGTYAQAIGVDLDRLLIFQPDYGEEGYNAIVEYIKTGSISLALVDSHTAATPKAIVEGEVGQHTIGLSARISSVAVAKIKPLLKPYACTMIAISQLRTKFTQYSTSQSSTSGNAWKFYADQRIKLSRVIDKEKGMDKTTMEVIKNKCGRPFNKAELNVIWGKGIDRVGEVLKVAIDAGDVTLGGGGWYTLTPDIKLQGLPKVWEFMEDNPEFFKELENKVLSKIELEHGDESSAD